MIESKLALACRDVAVSTPNGQTRLGVLFVAPRWRLGRRSELDQRIDTWVERIQSVTCDAVAWVFPKCQRHLRAYGYFYPGVAVFVRRVRRWRRRANHRRSEGAPA